LHLKSSISNKIWSNFWDFSSFSRLIFRGNHQPVVPMEKPNLVFRWFSPNVHFCCCIQSATKD
jgi:hypothetical protein